MTLVRHQVTDARTGEVSFIQVDDPDVLTEEQGIALQQAREREVQREAIRSEMDAADVRILRAVLEGYQERVAAHMDAQAERRAQLKALSD